MPDPSLVAAVERDFIAAWWLLADTGGHQRHVDGRLRWFHIGADDPYLNAVLETRLQPEEADAVLDRTLDELRSRGRPFLWWHMPSSSPRDLGDRLVARGLEPLAAWPGMALEIDRLVEPPAVPGLEIRRITTDGELHTYFDVVAPILDLSTAFVDVLSRASTRIGYAEDAAEVHFIGFMDDAPVATASLVTAGGTAGIYNVATIDSMRGRGIGAAMSAAVVGAGARRGLRTATLQASTMGRPVYDRLGFVHVCDLVPYRSPSVG